ncbi:hypothetical protein BHE74_00056259 [Ensete ventricosum]|nr:hypothetical protein GW17_00049484 [Ensete ventricosum]RWW38501.1 hypothetical protein BHE74_00056259 [Ensete ventricosum]
MRQRLVLPLDDEAVSHPRAGRRGVASFPRRETRPISTTVQHNAYHEDPYAREFGIKISDRLASVEARVLPAPWVPFTGKGVEDPHLIVVASQDWPETTKYAGLVSAQAHRQELIQDLFKVWQDPQRGTITGGMISYARCTRSVSIGTLSLSLSCSRLTKVIHEKFASNYTIRTNEIPNPNYFMVLTVPPAYYAHLAAFRARFYMEPETSDDGSIASGAVGRAQRGGRVLGGGAPVRPLPALKENIKKVMFYC